MVARAIDIEVTVEDTQSLNNGNNNMVHKNNKHQGDTKNINPSQGVHTNTVPSKFQSLFANGFGACADGALGAAAQSVVNDIDTFLKGRSKTEADTWKVEIVSHGELPNGQCVIIYARVGNDAFVHPVLFADCGGRKAMSNSYDSIHNQLIEIRESDALFVNTESFDLILKSHLRRSLGVTVDSVIIAGTTLYGEHQPIPANNLMSNATNELLSKMSVVGGFVNPNTLPLARNKGGEVTVDVLSVPDKKDLYGRDIFTPITLSLNIRKRMTQRQPTQQVGAIDNNYNQQQQQYTSALGEVCGYMDMVPLSNKRREQERQDVANGRSKTGVPALFQAYYTITAINWGNQELTSPTLENLITSIMAIPSLVNDSIWVSRIINAGQAGFNPLYDLATVGYDEDLNKQDNKPWDQVHSPVTFDAGLQAGFASQLVKGMGVRLDIPKSGPNAGMFADLLNKEHFNNAICALTGAQGSSYAGIGRGLGIFPMGTYINQGQKRDIRELLNYFSWGKYVAGDRKRMIEYYQTFMVPTSSDNYERLYAKRLEMAREISNDTFELTDQCLRIDLNIEAITDLREAATSLCNIKFSSPRSRANLNDCSYGFDGSDNGLTASQSEGNGITGQWVTESNFGFNY